MDRRRKRSLRKSAREKLPAILGRQGGACHWCRRPVIHKRDLQARRVQIVRETCDRITWREKGRNVTALRATADHVIPLHAGGSNEVENIVAACFACNHLRGKKVQKVVTEGSIDG